CEAIHDLPDDHAAAAQPCFVVPGRVAEHQRLAAVRRGVCDDPRRAAALDHGRRLLPVRSGVPAVQCGLRGGDGLCALHGDRRDHVHPVPPRKPIRPLQPMTISTPSAFDTLTVEEPPPVEQEKRRRFRPHWPSPWHLVLIPLTFLLLVPFFIMVVTSLLTV